MRKTPEPNSTCDITSRKHRKSQMMEMWNGLYVHKSQYERRHPQDFIQPVRVSKPILNARPYKEPTFAPEAIPDNVILAEDGTALITEQSQYIVGE